MFYVWLFTSGFLILSILTQLGSFSYGIIPNFMNIIMTIALEITTASLMIKKMKEPHKASYSIGAVGLWFFYYGLFMIFTFNQARLPIMMVRRVELGLLIVAVGSLIYYYNQKTQEVPGKQEMEKLKLVTFDRDEKLFDLVFEIESLLSLKEVENNNEFSRDLETIELYIREIQEKDIYVSQTFLEQITEIFRRYYSLSVEPVTSDEVTDVLVKAQNLAKQIKTAFKLMINKELIKEVRELDYQITALSNVLKLNGLAESDFEKIDE